MRRFLLTTLTTLSLATAAFLAGCGGSGSVSNPANLPAGKTALNIGVSGTADNPSPVTSATTTANSSLVATVTFTALPSGDPVVPIPPTSPNGKTAVITSSDPSVIPTVTGVLFESKAPTTAQREATVSVMLNIGNVSTTRTLVLTAKVDSFTSAACTITITPLSAATYPSRLFL